MSQADFAREIGVARSYVTALKKSGRLVLDDDGRVLVAESKASIARSNGAPERAAVVPQKFGDARERKEQAEAELKEIELQERRGALLRTAEVVAAVTAAATTLRSRLESFPDVLAPQLAAIADEQQIRAMLADEVELVLADLSGRFSALGRGAA
jgi:hypothetical protein